MADQTSTGFGSGNFDKGIGKTLKKLGKPLSGEGPLGFLKPSAEEILHQREATFLARSQRKIAVSNIGGGLTPDFDNSNLYGFSLMTFTGTIGSGWDVVNIKNVLKPPVTATLSGGDDIANVSSYFFNVNPKSISVSEPNAVHIIPTQNNGFYIESQGIVLRKLSISGTTGFRPSATKLSKDNRLPANPNEPTGFLNHIKLRNLFRNYSSLKKDQKQAKNTYMVWYNGLTQEAWFCEPESFSSSRDASSPFISRYEINVTLLHKVAFSAIVARLSPGLMGTQFWLESVRLASIILNKENMPGWVKTSVNYAKDISSTIEGVSKGIELVEKYATTALTLGGAAVGSFIALALPVLQSTKNLLFSVQSLIKTSGTLGLSIGDSGSKFVAMWEDFGNDLQSTLSSSIHSVNSLIMAAIDKRSSTPSQSLNSSQFGGKINMEGDADYTYIEGIVPDNIEDVDTILSLWAPDCDPETIKPLFFWANKLKYPYVSAVPSGSTVKPGDTIYIPFPNGNKIPPNLETKLFPLTITLGLYQELLGRDIRVVSLVTGTGQKSFDFAISATGDLDLIESTDNMTQAIYIKLNVERGELPLHPNFGFIDVVGMKSTLNLSFAANLAINDTMLSDGRIESISGLTIDIVGDVMKVYLNAHIIGNNSLIPITFSLGA